MSNPRTLPSNVLAEIPADAVSFWFFCAISWPGFLSPSRYTDFPGGVTANIDGTGSFFWDNSSGLQVGAISQGMDAANVVNAISFSNAKGNFTSIAASQILAGTPITIWIGWFDANGTFLSSFQLMKGEYDSAQLDAHAQIAVVPPQAAWGQDLPRPRYSAACPYIYMDQDTCGYSGALPTCAKTLTDCTAHSNQINFGGDPLMPLPGTVVAYGDTNRPMPGRDQLVNK